LLLDRRLLNRLLGGLGSDLLLLAGGRGRLGNRGLGGLGLGARGLGGLGRREAGATPLERLDEIKKLPLGLRGIGRRRHKGCRRGGSRRRHAAGALSWRRGLSRFLHPAQLLGKRQPRHPLPDRPLRLGSRIGRQQGGAPVGDPLRAFADLDPERSVDGAQEPVPIGALGRLAGRRVLVFHHTRGGIRRAFAGDGVIERGRQGVHVGPGTLVGAGRGILLVGAVARLNERADGTRLGGQGAAR